MLADQLKNKDLVKLCQVQPISSLSPLSFMFPNSEKCEQKNKFPEIKLEKNIKIQFIAIYAKLKIANYYVKQVKNYLNIKKHMKIY